MSWTKTRASALAMLGSAMLGSSMLGSAMLASAALAQAPQASPPPVSTALKSVSIETFASFLQDQGFRAEIAQGKTKRYVVTGMAGRRATVDFYDCREEVCGSIQYRVIFRADPVLGTAFANAWNRQRRYAKAYLLEDDRLVLEMDYDLDGGVSTGALQASMQNFQRMIGLFDSFVDGWRAERRREAPQAPGPARSTERPA